MCSVLLQTADFHRFDGFHRENFDRWSKFLSVQFAESVEICGSDDNEQKTKKIPNLSAEARDYIKRSLK
jgi:hypothetical protein